jgi:hypothetical protein
LMAELILRPEKGLKVVITPRNWLCKKKIELEDHLTIWLQRLWSDPLFLSMCVKWWLPSNSFRNNVLSPFKITIIYEATDWKICERV